MGLHLGVLRIPILKAAPNFFQAPFIILRRSYWLSAALWHALLSHKKSWNNSHSVCDAFSAKPFEQDIDLTETIFGSVEGGRRHHRGGTRILPTDKPFLQYKYITEQTIFDTKIGFFSPIDTLPKHKCLQWKDDKDYDQLLSTYDCCRKRVRWIGSGFLMFCTDWLWKLLNPLKVIFPWGHIHTSS